MNSLRLMISKPVLCMALAMAFTLSVSVMAGICPVRAAEPDPAHGAAKISLADAVLLALDNNTNIKLAKQDVSISRGDLESVRGGFDTVLNASLSQGHTYDPLSQIDRLAYRRNFQTTFQTSYGLSAKKLLRNGVTLKPTVTVARTGNTLEYPEVPASQAKVDFAVIVPLMRGLGEEATGAPERAAKLTWQGVMLDYYHSAAQNIYAAITDYWQLRQSQMVLAVYADSEKRAAKLLEQSTELVKGEQLPRSELTNLRANLDFKSAQRLSAATQLSAAREALANTLGLAAYGRQSTPIASDDFPERADISYLSRASLEKFKQLALANRADLKSAKLKAKSAQETLTASLDGLQPKLNLTLSAGYNGLSEDEAYSSYYNSLSDGVYGLNAVVTLDFEFPPARTSARGEVLAGKASLQKAKLVVIDTSRRIKLGVISAFKELRSSAQQVKRAGEAVANYQQAVRDERMKLKLATSTILNVIQVEDQLTSALLNDASAKQSFASAVARMRFETGTLVSGDPEKAQFAMNALNTLPQAEAGP